VVVEEHSSREVAMMKPKSRSKRANVEREPAKDDDARLETFERESGRRNDETLTRPDALDPETERMDIND
jgi:hypothetical protein